MRESPVVQAYLDQLTICPRCGIGFAPRPYQGGRPQKFCSDSCANEKPAENPHPRVTLTFTRPQVAAVRKTLLGLPLTDREQRAFSRALELIEKTEEF